MVKNREKNKIVKASVSVIILKGEKTDNELLTKCLKSVSWADEIVTIETQKINGSFSEWRNEGIKKSKGDWIFYVDTDEEVTQNLQREIELIITNEKLRIYTYAVPRRNIIFGKEFKHSGQYPDYQIRLFKKTNLKKWVGKLHEQPEYEGILGYLKNSLVHHKNMTISEMIDKTNKWSEIEADLMIEAKHPPMNFVRFLTAGLREFSLWFVKEKAFLDGKEGVIYGIYQIYSKLISYSKLWEKQQSTIRI